MPYKKKEVRRVHVALGCVFRKTQPIGITSSKTEASYYQVLLARRKEVQLPEIDNMWELPGGKVEPNELPRSTVEREVMEETGYFVKAIAPLDIVYTVVRDYPDYKQETLISCYECELVSTEKVLPKSFSKIGEVEWFRVDEINYFKTLAGSREFLFFLAGKYGINIKTTHQKTISFALFQVPVEIENNNERQVKRKGREYVINIQLEPDLSNYYIVTFRRGMNRRKWRPKIEDFKDNESMIKKAKERVTTRFQHGYLLVDYDDDFPILEWIKSKRYPIRKSASKTRFSQMILPIFNDDIIDNQNEE